MNQNPSVIGPAAKRETPINPPSKTSKTTNVHKIEGENLQTCQIAPSKTSKTQVQDQDFLETCQNPTAKTAKSQLDAEQLGLVATWSIEFGYISLHDPTTGEWHDLPTKDAPDWAKREAFKRRELYKAGNRKAYRLTSREMEKIWEAERAEMWEHPAVTDKGIVFEDYIEEDELGTG